MQYRRNQIELDRNVLTLVVHLERSVEREAQVADICAKSPFPTEVISAVDARLSDGSSHEAWGRYQQDLLVPRYPYALRDSEVACFRSHRKCWAMIIEKGLDAALIIEDDVEIAPEVFADAVAIVMQALFPGDFVRFPYKRREDEGEVIARKDEVVVRRPREVALGMQAQIVTRDAARRLLNATQSFDRPVDCLLQMPWEHKVRVLSVWPSGISENSQALGGSTIGHKTFGLSKIKREIQRPLYRYRLSRLARTHFDQTS